jgi:beta-lactam-binding protein with PASTA domain
MKLMDKLRSLAKECWYFLSSRQFLLNIGAMIGSFLLVMTILFFGISNYTLHGTSVSVPGFVGLSFEQAQKLAEKDNFRLVVNDSVFDKKAAQGLILEQYPKAGAGVKNGRTIYVTKNTTTAPLVSISYNQVIGRPRNYVAKLFKKNGLELGKETAVACKGANTVVALKLDGKTLLQEADPSKGEQKPTLPAKIPMAARLEICYCKGGTNGDDAQIEAPELVCVYYEDALMDLELAGLSVGTVRFLGEASRDTLSAFVCTQRPLPGDLMKNGGSINLELCVEKPESCP